MANTARHVVLRSGDVFPLVGLGTWKAAPGVVRDVVYEAIKLGYRHLDCACDYGNEVEVGQGIRKALDEGLCKRADLFVTSKLWNTFHRPEHVEMACKKSLSDLGLDYVDLYLIHFPISLAFVPIEKRYPPEWVHDPEDPAPCMKLDHVPTQVTWQAMESLVDQGLARNIGVSNFSAQLLMDVLHYARIPPAVNQIELHPYLSQKALVQFCQSQGVQVTGYSNLGSSSYVSIGMDQGQGVGVLNEPVLHDMAKRLGRSVAQVVLRWNVQRGVVVIPKTSNPKRLAENLSLFDFQLSPEDMDTLYALNRNVRFNDPGLYCTFEGEPYPIFA